MMLLDRQMPFHRQMEERFQESFNKTSCWATLLRWRATGSHSRWCVCVEDTGVPVDFFQMDLVPTVVQEFGALRSALHDGFATSLMEGSSSICR